MSAYDLFALHLRERETMHVDLEHRRRVLERLAHEREAGSDAAPGASGASGASAGSATGSRRVGGLRRLLPGGA